ncbi:SixA phosphatase family protein [Poriferisphaera sp. WC338]|uniref:SixA phosphatase family protein n=1 Tax=Poriferisphaera sp. WC338 TaxID=3425129 RepID=UPI003D81711A
MHLILFRHGIAEPGTESQPDDLRPLTALGLSRTMLAAQGLARIIDRPQAILSSTKTRAVQTAAFLGDTFDIQPETHELLATGTPKKILRMLRDRAEDSILIVGHEPVLSHLIELICIPKSPSGAIELKKAGCAYVEAPIRNNEPANPDMLAGGVLRWVIPPRILRQLAGEP